MTKYYDEFLRYVSMAKVLQKECNLGTVPYADSSIDDDLMKNVQLYDVVERKYAGFSQVILDIVYATSDDHPFRHKLSESRKHIVQNFSCWWEQRSLPEMLYVFLVHRLTGSGINYAHNPSGYYNTILPEFYKADSIAEMAKIIKEYDKPKFTSCGYQIAAFPKPIGDYKRGGDFFMCEMLPELCTDLALFLSDGKTPKTFREVGDWMFDWNQKHGLRRYIFQYAAFLSDIVDFISIENYIDPYSNFYYGSNARECIKYMAEPNKSLKGDTFLDAIMSRAVADTGYASYNVEDQMCDMIRWVENYIQPGKSYDHLDMDKVWNSSTVLLDHPYGRQKMMLELGLVKTFNDFKNHPSDDTVIKACGLTADEYKYAVDSYLFQEKLY